MTASSITVKAKLRIVFFLFFLISCGITLFNSYGLRKIEANITSFSSNTMLEETELQELNADTTQFRLEESAHMLSASPQQMAAHEAQMQKLNAAIEDIANKFRSGNITEEEKKIITELMDNWHQYYALNAQTLALSRQYTSPETIDNLTQASTIYNTQSKPFYDKVDKLTDQLVDLKTKETSVIDEDILTLSKATINNGVILAVLAALLNLMIAIFFEVTVLRYLLLIATRMRELATGNTALEIEGANRGDEIGSMAKSLLVFKDSMLARERMEREQKQLEIAAEAEKKDMMKKLANDFQSGVQGIIDGVAAAATNLYETASNMQTTVSNVSQQSNIAAASSQQTSGNVQSVSAAVEEMSASVREIASQITKSSALVSETVIKTQQADKTTQMLSEAVMQISGILQMIQDIAGQINLLALNATIESARAGDAGKGFAVVASEVKNLAGQTTKATEEIAKQIANVQQASQEVVEVLKSIQGAISNVNQYSSGIASAVEEQSAATNEISTNMHHASESVQNITSNIASITQGATDADSASREVLKASQMLSKQSEELNQQVGLFLERIRS